MLDLNDRETIEEMYRETGGERVTFAGGETWGHFNIEPKVELDHAQVLDNVPTLTVPQAVSELRMDVAVTVVGQGSFLVTNRMPADAPGEVMLVLREAPDV